MKFLCFSCSQYLHHLGMLKITTAQCKGTQITQRLTCKCCICFLKEAYRRAFHFHFHPVPFCLLFLTLKTSWPRAYSGVFRSPSCHRVPYLSLVHPTLLSSLSQLCNLQCIREGATFAVPHPKCSKQDTRQPAFLSWNQCVFFPAQDPPNAKLTLCYFPDSWHSILLINFSRSCTWHQWNFHLKILHRNYMHPLVMKLISVCVIPDTVGD